MQGEPSDLLASDEWDDPGVEVQLLLPVACRTFDPGMPGHIGLIIKTVAGRSELQAYTKGEKVARPIRFILPDKTAVQLAADLVKAVQKAAPGKA